MSNRSKRSPMPKKNSITKWDFVKDIFVPIAVCACAAYIAVQANRIANLQAMIAKNAERPTIEVTEHSFLDNFESEMEDSIEITILDGKYSNYQSEIITFLTCKYDDFDKNSQYVPFKTFEIPISSYYDTHFKSQSVYGKVESICTFQNTTQLRSLTNHAKEKYEMIPDRTFMTSVESYLKITYTNLLDEQETVYYLLDGNEIGPVSRLNEAYGEVRFKEWHDAAQNGLQIFPGDTASDLFRVLSMMDKTWDLYKEPDR